MLHIMLHASHHNMCGDNIYLIELNWKTSDRSEQVTSHTHFDFWLTHNLLTVQSQI